MIHLGRPVVSAGSAGRFDALVLRSFPSNVHNGGHMHRSYTQMGRNGGTSAAVTLTLVRSPSENRCPSLAAGRPKVRSSRTNRPILATRNAESVDRKSKRVSQPK